MKTRRLSKLAKATVFAYERGYRVAPNGDVIAPRGNVRKCHVKATSASRYPHCTFNLRFGDEVIPVVTAQLAVYQKYGLSALRDGIVVRHLNNRSLDNRLRNVTIGSRTDNAFDVPAAERRRRARKGGIASAKARKKRS